MISSLHEDQGHSKKATKPAKFLVPGFFLLLLGLGNLTVGTIKGDEYEQILSELSTSNGQVELANASLLRRFKMAKLSADRLNQRRKIARGRVKFYGLVSLGGYTFLLFSAPLIGIGTFMHLKRKKQHNDITLNEKTIDNS